METRSPLTSSCELRCTNTPSCHRDFLIEGNRTEVLEKMEKGEIKCPLCGGTDNYLRSSYSAPKLNGPATICHWSDCDSATVIGISPSGKTITIQEDTQKLLNAPNSNEPDRLITYPGGFAGHTEGVQRWACTPNPEGSVRKVRYSKKACTWKVMGNTDTVIFSGRYPHYDFNF